MFRSDHNAVLQQYRTKLETSLNSYKSVPLAVELQQQEDTLAKSHSELQEAVTQRDAAQHELSEKYRQGMYCFRAACLSLTVINAFLKS